jgi:mannose-6-phosphate isomerase-like protein (cupin superfamily)
MTATTTREPDFARIGEVGEVRGGRNYALVRLGGAKEWVRYGVKHPAVPTPVMGKVFLKALLGLTAMEISFGVLPAQASMPFLHRHRENEEVYLFVGGRGQVQIDGEVLDVEEGTAVRVAPEGVRAWRNTSSEDLLYIVIQAKDGSLTAWTGTDGMRVPGPVEWPATAG